MDNRRIVKSAFSMSIVTFVSRVFGLVREWLRGYLLGTSGSSDAFALAFMFPNLLRRLVGEGAMTAAFVPVLSDYIEKNEKSDLDDFINSFFSMLFFFLIFIVTLMIALAPVLKHLLPEFAKSPEKMELTIFLSRMMFPYIFFISLAALTQSILNTYKIFVPSAMTPILLNISIISAGLLLGYRVRNPAIALGIGVLVGGLLQFFFPLPFLLKRDIKYRFSFRVKNPGVRKVFFLMLPGTVGAGVYQINTLVSQFIAATLEEGSVAALRFSNVLVEVALGVFVISLSTVILPALSERSSKGDMEGMKKTLSFAMRLVFLITLPAMFGLIVLRVPLVRMLFRYGQFTEQSTAMVAYALLFHAPGLFGTGGTRVIAQMFFAMKDTKTPVYVAAVVMTVNILLCFALLGPLKLGGIALAGSVSAFLNFFLLLIILRRRTGRIITPEVVYSMIKSLLSSVIMAGVLYLLLMTFSELMSRTRVYNAGLTVLFLLVGIFIFFILNVLFKNRDVLELKKIISGKFGFK
ncbi:MAG TPA: murein biosynthesis integral membrane protein MurJ [Spirochaetes bacterium]|nr:murein biosynthesis integral membrane protein MurJ [Spirochaetota bacterium]